MRESHTKEIKKWEDKYYDLERKFETEKNSLIENNAKITKQLQQQKTFGKISTHEDSKNEPERLNTLDDVLGEEGNELDNEECGNENDSTMLKMRIVSLESQITILNNNISDLKFSLDNIFKEKEILSTENKKLKENNSEAVKLYEKQIADLQKNSNKLHIERTSLKRSIIGGDITDSLNPKQLQMLNELNKTIATLKAENKFLSDANEILTKEKSNIQLLRTNDVAYYKEELKKAEQIAVNAKIQFATYVFEKEEEVIKLKQLNKKFMDKLGLTFK
jgi:regulator of replication initiation timing